MSDTVLKYPSLCTISLLLYVMVLKTISPDYGVQASLMLFSILLKLGKYIHSITGKIWKSLNFDIEWLRNG